MDIFFALYFMLGSYWFAYTIVKHTMKEQIKAGSQVKGKYTKAKIAFTSALLIFAYPADIILSLFNKGEMK